LNFYRRGLVKYGIIMFGAGVAKKDSYA